MDRHMKKCSQEHVRSMNVDTCALNQGGYGVAQASAPTFFPSLGFMTYCLLLARVQVCASG